MKLGRRILSFAAAVTFLTTAASSSPQIQYRSGQDVTPAFEGWTANPDGTFNLYFGYLNRNYEEEVDVPLGPNNTIEPGGDRGQPTHFYPRRQSFVFKVVVPKDWGLDKKVVWTLINRGKTNAAKGWLQPEWEINKEIMMQNSDDGGGNDLENQPPTITGNSAQTVTLPDTLTVKVNASDDGRPKARNGQSSLSIRWIQYRGPGPVTFEPTAERPVAGKPVASTAKVAFGSPGNYVLRAIASDGALQTTYDIPVTVK